MNQGPARLRWHEDPFHVNGPNVRRAADHQNVRSPTRVLHECLVSDLESGWAATTMLGTVVENLAQTLLNDI